METPNFTVNCTKSTQFTSPHGESHEISAIHTNFEGFPALLSKTPNLTANYAKSAQFANPYSESRRISQICTVSNAFYLFAFRHS